MLQLLMGKHLSKKLICLSFSLCVLSKQVDLKMGRRMKSCVFLFCSVGVWSEDCVCMLLGDGLTLHETDKYTFATFVHVGLSRSALHYLLCMHRYGCRVMVAVRFWRSKVHGPISLLVLFFSSCEMEWVKVPVILRWFWVWMAAGWNNLTAC